MRLMQTLQMLLQPYWQVNFTAADSRVIKKSDMTGACGGFYNDFSGNMGIVGTPVIDSTTNTLYVVARSVIQPAVQRMLINTCMHWILQQAQKKQIALFLSQHQLMATVMEVQAESKF